MALPLRVRFARSPAGGLWLLMLLASAALAWRANYVADLSAFLPDAPTAEQRLLVEQLRSGVTSRALLVGIRGGSAQQRIALSQALAERLRASGLFEVVHNGDTHSLQEGGALLFGRRYLLSPAVDAQRFTAQGLSDGIADTLALLGTPAGALLKPILWRDPTGETVRMAEAMLPAEAPRSEGGVWVSRSAPRALLVLTTRADGADLDAQMRAVDAVQQGFAALVASPVVTSPMLPSPMVAPSAEAAAGTAAATDPLPAAIEPLRLELAGPPLFAVESRALIRSEVEKLALLGAVAAVALLLAVFGSVKTLFIAVLPVASGVLAGISAVSLGFGSVHGMTLGFGTTLIGEAVDYAIYYLIQTRPLPTVFFTPTLPGRPRGLVAATVGWQRWVAYNWPAVRLGLLTSLAGFSALVFSGFGGLAQLGVFSVAGLAAAALTTRFVLPLLAPEGASGQGLRVPMGRATAAGAAVLARLRWPLAAVTVAALAVLLSQPSGWRGNLAALSTVPADALALDASLRSDLGAAEAGVLVAVEGADEAATLMRAEAVGRLLDGWVASGQLAGYSSPARMLPSPATQLARRAALPAEAPLREALLQATRDGPLPLARLEPFVQDLQAQRTASVLTLADLAGTPLAAALQAQLVPGRDGRPWLALIGLQLPAARPAAASAASASAPPTSTSTSTSTSASESTSTRPTPGATAATSLDVVALRSALTALPGARVVQVNVELDALYAHYLREALWQAALGALVVVLLLAGYLRSARRLGQVLLPLVASAVLVMAALTLAGVALGVLHLVGLLLVIAVGSNYALFFDHLRESGHADHDTLASLLVANVTTVVSFVLLAASKVAVLAAVGQVVAPGAALALILSAAFIGMPRAGRDDAAPAGAGAGPAGGAAAGTVSAGPAASAMASSSASTASSPSSPSSTPAAASTGLASGSPASAPPASAPPASAPPASAPPASAPSTGRPAAGPASR